MTAALLLFSKIVAWLALVVCTLAVMVNTAARATVSPVDELKMKLEHRTWRSRAPFVLGAAIATAWLYASWGAS